MADYIPTQFDAFSTALGLDPTYITKACFYVPDGGEKDVLFDEHGCVIHAPITLEDLERCLPLATFLAIWRYGKDLDQEGMDPAYYKVIQDLFVYVDLCFQKKDVHNYYEALFDGITVRLDQAWHSYKEGRVSVQSFKTLLTNIKALFRKESQQCNFPEEDQDAFFNMFCVYAGKCAWIDGEFTGILINPWPDNDPPIPNVTTHPLTMVVDYSAAVAAMPEEMAVAFARRVGRQQEFLNTQVHRNTLAERSLEESKYQVIQARKAEREAELRLVQEKKELAKIELEKLRLQGPESHLLLENGPAKPESNEQEMEE